MSIIGNRISRAARSAPSLGLKTVWHVHEAEQFKTSGSWLEFLSHHLRMAWAQLRNSPINTAMTTVIMAVVLSLSVLGVLIIHNTHGLLEHARGSVGLTIYLGDGDEGEFRARLESYFKADKRIASARFESKEDALKTLRSETPSVSTLLGGLDARNPLPASYVVTVEEADSTPAIYQELRQRLQQFPGVELVQYNNSLLGELSDALRFLNVLGWVAVVGMLMVASFIVALTIIISVDKRREEILVMRLVGATERFIQLPFIFEGVFKGILGGVLGVAFAFAGFSVARRLLEDALPFVSVWSRVAFLSWSLVGGILGVVAIVGALASMGAVRRAISPMDA